VKQTNNGEIESSYAGKYEETTLSTAVWWCVIWKNYVSEGHHSLHKLKLSSP
jgi:hypothetical protein